MYYNLCESMQIMNTAYVKLDFEIPYTQSTKSIS